MSTMIWKDFELLNEQHWVASDFKGRGEMEFKGHLRFSGEWIGSIRSEDPEACLYLLKGSKVVGAISVANIVVGGQILDATVKAENFQALTGSFVSGRVKAAKLRMEEGAILDGELSSAINQ